MVKTTLRYSKIYNFCFLRDYSKDELNRQWQWVQDCGKTFEPLYKKHITKILNTIPKYTGVKWEKFNDSIIHIYMMSMKGPSFHQPLTLRIRKDPKMMMAVLIHELVHNNIPPDQFHNHLESENCVNEVTFKILNELGIKDDKYISLLTKFTMVRFGKKYKPSLFDVKKETIIKYLGTLKKR